MACELRRSSLPSMGSAIRLQMISTGSARALTVDFPDPPVGQITPIWPGVQVCHSSLRHGIGSPRRRRSCVERKQTRAVQTKNRSFGIAVGRPESRKSVFLLHILGNFHSPEGFNLPLRRTKPKRIRSPDDVIRPQALHQQPNHGCGNARIADATTCETGSHVRVNIPDTILAWNFDKIGHPIQAASLLELCGPNFGGALNGRPACITVAGMVNEEVQLRPVLGDFTHIIHLGVLFEIGELFLHAGVYKPL